MKIIGISCSPRRRGNTEILVKESLKGARESGAKTEFLSVASMKINPCNGCLHCKKKGDCRIKDDMKIIYRKALESEGIIFGTPVYFWSMCAQAKMVMDRMYAFRYPHLKLANKVGGIIVVASSHGHLSVIHNFNQFFISNHMLPADWVFGFAREKGDIVKNKHAMKTSYELGRLVAALASQKFQYPEEFKNPIYWLVKNKYGVDPCPF